MGLSRIFSFGKLFPAFIRLPFEARVLKMGHFLPVASLSELGRSECQKKISEMFLKWRQKSDLK